MARRPHEQDQDFNWETDFPSEETQQSKRFVPPEEEDWAEEPSPFDERVRPKHAPPRFDERARHEHAPPRFDERIRPEHTPPVSDERLRPEHAPPLFDERIRPHQADGTSEQRPIVIWPEDDTPKMGRAMRGVYVAFLVVLAFGAVWVLERDIAGPATEGNQSQAANVPSSSPAPLPPPAPGPDPVAPDTNAPAPSTESIGSALENLVRTAPEKPLAPKPADQPARAPQDTPARPRLDAAAPPPATSATTSGATAARSPTAAPGSTAPSRSTASVPGGQTRPAPPERRLNIEPPARPPYRSIPESTPPRPATAESKPPARVTPPPSQVTTPSPPPVTTSPSPPRAAAAETTPVPPSRVAVDEPELRPPAPPAPPPSAPPSPEPAAAPPTAAPTAAASPAPASPPPAAVDVDNAAIRDVLGRYRTAFNALDAGAAQAVWPTVNYGTLDRAFGQLQEQNLSFDKCTIAVKGALAQANCSGTTRFVPRVGSRSVQTAQRQWSFQLRKGDRGGWLIQNVEAR